MSFFVDKINLIVSSGHGGAGCISFRREASEPKGGPDGGDGGKGGNVVFFVKSNLKTLSHLRHKVHHKAQDGIQGSSANRIGKNGKDVIIEVPPGSIIKDASDNSVLFDLKNDGEKLTFLKGGIGGKGNTFFKSSTNQTPYKAQPGRDGFILEITVELSLIADIGFLALPNAGKSSLLKSLTKANPEVAAYPFTTKIPNLGVMRIGYIDVVLADIPGIIKGASQGIGLGHQFLKHVLRTKSLAILIDLSMNQFELDYDFDDMKKNYEETYDMLINELYSFSDEFRDKKKIIIGTKLDLIENDRKEEVSNLFKETFKDSICISCITNENIDDLKKKFLEIK